MSASLVGSEMCIRDSSQRPRSAVLPCTPFLASCGTRKRARGRNNARGAVSYTHLTLPTICSV
eukprot:6754721-Alexandrium_andersonii.AAC.1